ncbi:hypothetical protein 000TH008_65 [Bacillus phage 000TH008]|nr:hypothetical protein 000TH008_65 [Bacillus phage 000TH008]QQO40759.1 hypothetical protein 000TH009_65 [Bacillus phage 000TH009]
MLEKFEVPVVRTVVHYTVVDKGVMGRPDIGDSVRVLLEDNDLLKLDPWEVAHRLPGNIQFALDKLGLGDIEDPREINFRKTKRLHYIGTHPEKLRVEIHAVLQPVLEYAGTVFSLAEARYDYTEADLTY